MADYEENIRSGVACSGARGTYVGTLSYLPATREKPLRTPAIHFGGAKGYLNEPLLVVREALNLAEYEYGIKILPEQLIAASVLRLCERKRHLETEPLRQLRQRAERVGSFAIAQARENQYHERTAEIEAVEPLNRSERRTSAHGIGRARRTVPGAWDIDPLVHLPVTRYELGLWPVRAAVRTAARASTPAHDPYVALHVHDSEPIEQIVFLEDLV